jgi:hypothetical protein
MIRFLFRTLGLLLLAAAFVFFVYDGTKSIAANALATTRLSEFWNIIDPSTLQQLEPYIKQHATAWLWDSVMVTILDAPAFAVFGIVGVVLVLLGRRKKPQIGYAR